MWNRLCDIIFSRRFWNILDYVCFGVAGIVIGVNVFMTSTRSEFVGYVIAAVVILVEVVIRHFLGKTRRYYDIVSGGVLVVFGIAFGIVAILIFLDYVVVSLMFMMLGGMYLFRGLWNQGWRYQAVITAVTVGVLALIPFLVLTDAIIPRKPVAGDYSAHAVCDECGKPADGGIDRVEWLNPTYYCRSCFEHNEESAAGYPDCEVEGCDNAKVSAELTFCKDHVSKCEHCNTYIYPGYRWCDACRAVVMDAVE